MLQVMGTTTAIVLTEALIKSGNVHITSDLNTTEVIRYINKVSEQVLCMLKKKSVDVDDKRLLDVASIAANNNSEIGEIISKAYEKVGKHGIVTVEKSMTAETYAEVTNGIRVDRGYTSNLFINNQRKDECILEDVQVLVCDTEISNILQIESVLKPIIQQNQKLLIIGECSQNVINTLAANVVRNGLKLCNIIPPNFGYKKHELMQDIAISVGAKYFSESTGDDLSLINSNDLGHADKIIVGKDSSVIIKHNQLTQEIKNRIEELKEQQSNAKQIEEKKFINERIASLSGAIGCIYVGGNSDVEQKEKFDRVDDSVCAVKSALDEGIIAGGGIALWDIADGLGGIAPLDNDKDASKEEKVAYHIMYETIKTPLIQILENAGKDYKKITNEFNKAKHKSKRNFGYDAKNEKYGDMFKLGIIDPLKVTRNALINAVSVATTILSTNAIVTHARVNQQK